MKSTLIKCVLALLAVMVSIWGVKFLLDTILSNVSYLLAFGIGYIACVVHTQYLENKK